MFRVDAKGRSKFELRGYLGENKESANYRELPAQWTCGYLVYPKHLRVIDRERGSLAVDRRWITYEVVRIDRTERHVRRCLPAKRNTNPWHRVDRSHLRKTRHRRGRKKKMTELLVPLLFALCRYRGLRIFHGDKAPTFRRSPQFRWSFWKMTRKNRPLLSRLIHGLLLR